MEVHMNTKQYLQPSMERLPRCPLEARTKLRPRTLPTSRRRTRHRGVAKQVFLHQLHVAMTTHLVHFRQLGFHPVVVVEGGLEHLAHKGVQLEEGERSPAPLPFLIKEGC